jgi:nitrogen-specific signal transduction histidine kinase
LFDPFVTMGKPNGTGLGLTLARRIAEEHEGSVVLEESNPKGTIFTLSLTKNRLLT